MKNAILVDQSLSGSGQVYRPIAPRPSLTVGTLLRRLTDLLRRWRMLARERYELQTLSDEMLKDIGISRADAEREAQRNFWDDKGIRR